MMAYCAVEWFASLLSSSNATCYRFYQPSCTLQLDCFSFLFNHITMSHYLWCKGVYCSGRPPSVITQIAQRISRKVETTKLICNGSRRNDNYLLVAAYYAMQNVWIAKSSIRFNWISVLYGSFFSFFFPIVLPDRLE